MFVSFVLGAALNIFAAEITSFTVTEMSSIGPAIRYVKGGIPLPEGKYSSIEKFAVLAAGGKEIPAEISVLNTWLDGSLKWVLVEFAAAFEAGQKTKYTLVELENKIKLPEKASEYSEKDFGNMFEFILKGEKQDFISSKNKVQLLSSSPLKKSWLLTGIYEGAENKEEKADYYCKVESFEGVPGLFIRLSLTSKCAGEAINVSRFAFKARYPGKILKAVFEKEGLIEESISGLPVTKKVKMRTQTNMQGWVATLGEQGNMLLTCEDFAELCPTAFVVDGESVTLEMYNNEEKPYQMIQGSATTHHLRLFKTAATDKEKLRVEGTAALNVLMPVCTPEWYCSSKAFGNIAKADPEKFPRFESIVESNFKYLNQNQLKANEFGIKDYGDYNHSDHWGNMHYDLPYVMFQQFARSGDLRFFTRGVAAARHMIDVDTIWHNSNLNFIGGVYVEGKGHNLARGTYMGFAKNHGPLAYYYLTGDERALQAGKLTGDYCAFWSKDPNAIIGNEERVAGYGLMCLEQAYKATHSKKYLKAARHMIDVLLDWQDKKTGAWAVRPETAGVPRPKSETNGCVFMLGGMFEAMIDYYEMTKEEDVKTSIIKGNEYLLSTLWKDGPEKYSINLLVAHAPAWCYTQTKDKKFIDAARNAYDIATRNNNAEWAGGKMLAQHWRAAPRFLYVIENDPELLKLGGY